MITLETKLSTDTRTTLTRFTCPTCSGSTFSPIEDRVFECACDELLIRVNGRMAVALPCRDCDEYTDDLDPVSEDDGRRRCYDCHADHAANVARQRRQDAYECREDDRDRGYEPADFRLAGVM